MSLCTVLSSNIRQDVSYSDPKAHNYPKSNWLAINLGGKQLALFELGKNYSFSLCSIYVASTTSSSSAINNFIIASSASYTSY